jgi:hydrogenase large subunit
MHTIFGGKNPHPNYLVGGVPCAINIDGNGAAGAPINMERLNFVKARIDEMIEFNNNVYIPDVLAIGTIYKAGWLYGGGLSATNVMTTAPMKRSTTTRAPTSCRAAPSSTATGTKIHPVDPRDPEQVQEFVTHSWYKYADETKGLHPWDGVTEPNYVLGAKTKGTAPTSSRSTRAPSTRGSSRPRWRGHAMEVGPLSRYILAYATPQGQQVLPAPQGAGRVCSAMMVNSAIPKALGLPETQYTPSSCCPPP